MNRSEFVCNCIRNTFNHDQGLLGELEQTARERNVPIITRETACLLTVLGRLAKPLRILEIGTAIGYSSILLARILAPGGRIDTIERDEEMLLMARENIRKAGLGDVIGIIAGDATEVLKCLDKQYDMVFLDAAKGQYPELLPDCLRLLKRGGLLVADNVLYKGLVAGDDTPARKHRTIVNRMRAFLEDLRNNPELETCIVPAGDGVAVAYKLLEEEMEQ
ncbi:MAG: O-methyltransferase [Acetivibrionales bacterium]